MTANADKKIERLRGKLQAGERGGSDADRERLLEFSDQLVLLSSKYSDHRHEHLLRRCTRMAEEVGGLADALEERSAAEDIVRWIHRSYDNEETNRDYRGALRVFGRRVGDEDEIPESIEWVSGATSRNYKPTPSPSDMLDWEDDVRPMIEAARWSRDKAMIAVAMDAGARSGEFRGLTVRDVTDHPRGLQITVDGKKGQRTVTLIPSVPYLQRWLEDHPGGRDDALWSKLHDPEGISYNMYRKILEGAADKAGVEKPVTLTNFRKSSASHLASQGVNQATLEDHHGWDHGSKVAARYVSVFGDASDRELARAHGLEVAEEDEPEPTGPITCMRCDKETPRHRGRCIHCGQALSQEANAEAEALQEAGYEAVGRLIQERGFESGDAASTIETVVAQQLDAKLEDAGFGDHDDSSSSS